jgi:hypothetical protein
LHPTYREQTKEDAGQINQTRKYIGNSPAIQTLMPLFSFSQDIMTRCSAIAIAASCTLLGGCAGFGAAPPYVGESEQAVIARFGEPTHRYQDGQNHLLEYAHGPWGQQTYMTRVGPDGRVISYEQVLSQQKFAAIKLGETTKDEVLRTIGAPSETTFLSLSQLEVWTYPYKESGVWDSMMHVHFDRNGIVRKMENGPDTNRDPERRFHFGVFSMP